MKEKISEAFSKSVNAFKKAFGFLKNPKVKNLKKPVKIALCVILAVAVVLAGTGIYKWKKTKSASSENDAGTSIVMSGNLTNSITGSGSVEPIDQREIVPEVNGKIIESLFEEGDEVKAGDVLYRFEMTAATNAIESAENNVQKAQTNLSNRQSNLVKVRENIEKLTVKATASGKISDLSLRVGEDASGKICIVTNFKEQTATVPFSSAHIGSINVGDKANVAVDKYMINTTGTVVRKYTASDTLPSGAVVYYVEIRLSNDYILEENVNVTATVGSLSSASYGTVKYADPVTINAEQKGKVTKVNFKNGDWVNEGEVIAVLKNSDLNDELRTAQQNLSEAQMNLTESLNNLEDKEEEANEYIVTSPIDGVILTKDYDTGDTINGQNAPSMMVIADMSKMKFTISVDELDISKIQMGQSVMVTADALEGQSLTGKITAISKLGTSSNGVTNYPIEVTIDEPGDLMPGMNVSAQIIVEQAYNTLYLPVEAVEYFGGKYYVTVVGEVENMPERREMKPFDTEEKKADNKENAVSQEEEQKEEKTSSEASGGRTLPEGGGNWQMGERPQRTQGEFGSQNFGGMRKSDTAQGEANKETVMPSEEQKEDKTAENEKPVREEAEKQEKEAPGENGQQKTGQMSERNQREELKIKLSGKEERVEVQIGIATDQYYEIKGGVEYGQVVKNSTQVSGSQSFGMGGGMPGMMGGMPAGMMGGMSGSRPQMNRNMGGR